MNEAIAKNSSNANQESLSIYRPGARLQLAREAARISQQEAANYLRLNIKTIDAIERDDYQKFPGVTFIKGYLRAYCKFLSLPADEIIASFDSLGIAENRKNINVSLYKMQPGGAERQVRWVAHIIGLILIALVFMWWQSRPSHDLIFRGLHQASIKPLPEARIAKDSATNNPQIAANEVIALIAAAAAMPVAPQSNIKVSNQAEKVNL